MMKLSGLMEKESKNIKADSSGKSLEVKDKIKPIIEKDASKKIVPIGQRSDQFLFLNQKRKVLESVIV
jgi:hypothetical protein